MNKTRLLIENASQILTMDSEGSNDVGLIENGYIYVEDDLIKAVGKKAEVTKYIDDLSEATIYDAKGKIVLPGFVDCHTHAAFGGSRVLEYSVKLTDESAKGLERLGKTGLYGTVDATNKLTESELEHQTYKRVFNMMASGTTTIEIKSGYGLSTKSEIKMLKAIKSLNEKMPIDIVSTFLGAHYWPENLSKEKYIDVLMNEMIPQVSELKLAKYSDIWCDDGYYTKKECEKVLSCGKDYGLIPRIHTDCYSYIGGSDLACEMQMASADHLNYTPVHMFEKLRDANVVGVVVAGTDFAVKHHKPFNPRPMLDSGMKLALATNCNPGVWAESMQFILILACRLHGFTPEEAIRAATLGGALALGMDDRGIIAKGKKADMQIWDLDTYQDIVYKFGFNHVQTVIKDGKIIVDNNIIMGV